MTALKEWNTNTCIPFRIKKTGLSFQMFSCSRKFSAGSNQKRVFPIFFPFGRGFPEIFREMVKTNNFARAAHFLYIYLPSLHDQYEVKALKVSYTIKHNHATKKLKLHMVFRNLILEGSAHILPSTERVRIIALNTSRTRIPFVSDARFPRCRRSRILRGDFV